MTKDERKTLSNRAPFSPRLLDSSFRDYPERLSDVDEGVLLAECIGELVPGVPPREAWIMVAKALRVHGLKVAQGDA